MPQQKLTPEEQELFKKRTSYYYGDYVPKTKQEIYREQRLILEEQRKIREESVRLDVNLGKSLETKEDSAIAKRLKLIEEPKTELKLKEEKLKGITTDRDLRIKEAQERFELGKETKEDIELFRRIGEQKVLTEKPKGVETIFRDISKVGEEFWKDFNKNVTSLEKMTAMPRKDDPLEGIFETPEEYLTRIEADPTLMKDKKVKYLVNNAKDNLDSMNMVIDQKEMGFQNFQEGLDTMNELIRIKEEYEKLVNDPTISREYADETLRKNTISDKRPNGLGYDELTDKLRKFHGLESLLKNESEWFKKYGLIE